MNKEIAGMVLAKLDAVVARLGMTVEQIWSWLVRQQYVSALLFSILLISFSLIGCVVYLGIKRIEWKNYNSVKEMGFIIMMIVSVFVVTATGIIFISEFPDILSLEYWVSKDLER